MAGGGAFVRDARLFEWEDLLDGDAHPVGIDERRQFDQLGSTGFDDEENRFDASGMAL